MSGYLITAYLVASYGFVQAIRARDGYNTFRFASWLIGISMFVWAVRNVHA